MENDFECIGALLVGEGRAETVVEKLSASTTAVCAATRKPLPPDIAITPFRPLRKCCSRYLAGAPGIRRSFCSTAPLFRRRYAFEMVVKTACRAFPMRWKSIADVFHPSSIEASSRTRGKKSALRQRRSDTPGPIPHRQESENRSATRFHRNRKQSHALSDTSCNGND
jgi:hypothetical protein